MTLQEPSFIDDSSFILLKDTILLIKFLYHLSWVECKSEVFWKISKLQTGCSGLRKFCL